MYYGYFRFELNIIREYLSILKLYKLNVYLSTAKIIIKIKRYLWLSLLNPPLQPYNLTPACTWCELIRNSLCNQEFSMCSATWMEKKIEPFLKLSKLCVTHSDNVTDHILCAKTEVIWLRKLWIRCTLHMEIYWYPLRRDDSQ